MRTYQPARKYAKSQSGGKHKIQLKATKRPRLQLTKEIKDKLPHWSLEDETTEKIFDDRMKKMYEDLNSGVMSDEEFDEQYDKLMDEFNMWENSKIEKF